MKGEDRQDLDGLSFPAGEVLDDLDDLFYVLDAAGRFVRWNDRLAGVTGREESTLAGTRFAALLPPDQRGRVPECDGEWPDDGPASFVGDLPAGDGERVPHEFRERRLTDDAGSVVGRYGVGREASDRRRRAERLRRSERRLTAMFENPWSYNALLDPDGTVRRVNGTALELVDVDEADVRGESVWETPWWDYADDHQERIREAVSTAADGERHRCELYDELSEDRYVAVDVSARPVRDADGEVVAVIVEGRDVTDRVERRRKLREEKAFTETVLDTVPDVLYAFDEEGTFLRWNENLPAVSGYDDEEIAEMSPTEFVAEEDRQAVRESIASVLDEGGVETVEAHLATCDGRQVPHEFNGGRLTDGDGEVLGIVGTGRNVADRRSRQRRLRRQRDELERLDRLNSVIREVDRLLVEAENRHEVERGVCERLADGQQYALAWMGEPDLADRTVEPVAAAGDGTDYPDAVTVTFDDGSELEPAGRAARTGEVATVQRIGDHPGEVPWREAALARDLRSAAAVPIRYGETLHAVLVVYATRPDAFDAREQAILSELGDGVGHALNAIMRRDVLLTDDVVEVEFRVAGAFEAVAEATRQTDGRLVFERVVHAADDEVLWFARAEGLCPETLLSLEEEPAVGSVRRMAGDGDEQRFEVLSPDPPLTSALFAHGGRVRRMVVEEGDLYVLAELPGSADVRSVVQSVREQFPEADLAAQRTATRSRPTEPELRSAVVERLTDRQQAALETALFGGYFDRERELTGDELADVLGITRSTFHEHLRAGHRKVLAGLFDGVGGFDAPPD